MALSRPLLLALLGVALLGATVFAVQNARNTAADDPAPVAQQKPTAEAASAPEQSAPAAPEEILRSALEPDAVESASFKASLVFTSRGDRNTLETSGAFELGSAREMPKADVQVNVDVPGYDLKAGFVTTGDRAWLTRGDTGYAVPQESWSQIVEARESGARPAAEAPKLDVDPSGWLRNVKSEGTERMDGVEVTHVSADVNSAGAIADIVKAMGQTGQVPAGAEARLGKVVKEGHLEAWVGEDEILRRVTFEMTGTGDNGRRVAMDLDLELSNVNKPQEIARPAKVKSGQPEGLLGQVSAGLLTGAGASVGVDAKALRVGVPVTNAHRRAERAVAKNRKVVILFQNPRALDDKAVAASVRALDRRTKAPLVLIDDVRNVDQYGSLVEDLGVNQAPAIVVIDRSGDASLIEGYIDAESLTQVVADAR